MVQIGLVFPANSWTWQLAHGRCPDAPGNLIRGELLSRVWQSRHGIRLCVGLVCRNFDMSSAAAGSGSLRADEGAAKYPRTNIEKAATIRPGLSQRIRDDTDRTRSISAVICRQRLLWPAG